MSNMTDITISLNDDFGDLSLSMQKALAFMFTRHMVSHCKGYGPEGGCDIRVAHPDLPCKDYEDMTTTVFGSRRILDAMEKRELVRFRFTSMGCFVDLTYKSFDLATQVMSSLNHALIHADQCVKKAS